MVFLAHGGLESVVPGGLGVTIFFVLSGYLISTLMRTEHAATGSIDLRNFYLRRLLRLMPPLFIVVAIAYALSTLGTIGGWFTQDGLLAALFYFGNYFVIAHDFEGMPAGLGVVWSLAVEEHYYLLYPPLALLLLRVGRKGLSATILTLLCLAVLAWRWWLATNGASLAYLSMATDTRVDAILVGCLMAMWRNPWLDTLPAQSATRDATLAATCVAVLAFTLLYRNELFRHTARYTLQSLAIAPLIYLAISRAVQVPFRWLNARPVAWLGTVSYTIYLSHHAILLGMERHWPRLGWGWLLCLAAVLTLVFAEAMRRWVDLPCARLRRRLHGRGESRRQPLPAAADAS
jgi:peptidoglycan/LPS O-acetylase OafA/YrhL